MILTDTDGLPDHVKILDFGLAKLRDGPAMMSVLAIGTPSYMSPEQTGAPGEIDGRTDIYAVGVVIHEMLAAQEALRLGQGRRDPGHAPGPGAHAASSGGADRRHLAGAGGGGAARTGEETRGSVPVRSGVLGRPGRGARAATRVSIVSRAPLLGGARPGARPPAAAAVIGDGDQTIADSPEPPRARQRGRGQARLGSPRWPGRPRRGERHRPGERRRSKRWLSTCGAGLGRGGPGLRGAVEAPAGKTSPPVAATVPHP